MSRRDPAETLRQIQDFCTELQAYVVGKKREDLAADRQLQRTAERLIELIGEACTRLSEDLRNRHPDVPWGKIIGMRNRLIHGYDTLDYDILWAVIESELPTLARQIASVVEAESGPAPASD